MSRLDFIKGVLNAARDCLDSSAPHFTRFLSESELALAKSVGMPKGVTAVFCGGAENRDPLRCCLGLFPSFYFDKQIDDASCEEVACMFPIKAVTIAFRSGDVISHRDILGSIMALGLDRDTVGDIFIEDGKAAVFVYDKVASHIADSLTKIGNVGVKCKTDIRPGFTLPERKFETLALSVASLRLDNIVKSAVGVSRTVAVEKYIAPQLVQLNGVVCTDCAAQLTTGDIFSVRGKGKFSLHSIDGTGRKGNIHITVKKYM